MKKLTHIIKSNSKIIAAFALIVVLAAAVLLINGSGESENSSAASVTKSESEIKLGSILSAIEGVGSADVLINESDGVISGVVIVCSGGNNIMVRNDILNAVSTALNIDKNIIAIYAMTE